MPKRVFQKKAQARSSSIHATRPAKLSQSAHQKGLVRGTQKDQLMLYKEVLKDDIEALPTDESPGDGGGDLG